MEYVSECHPQLNTAVIQIISDQEKGAKNALAHVLPSVKQFFCSSHREGNVYKNAFKATGKLLRQALNYWNEGSLNAIKAQLTTRGAYLSSVPDEQQYPLKRGGLFGRCTSQGCESINNANITIRKSDIESAYILAVEADQARHVKALKTLAPSPTNCPPPRIKHKLSNLRDRAHQFSFLSFVQILSNQGQKGRVPSAARLMFSYNVDLSKRSCTCGIWNGTNFPCIHAMILCNKAGRGIREHTPAVRE